jgi:hypothetical protein
MVNLYGTAHNSEILLGFYIIMECANKMHNVNFENAFLFSIWHRQGAHYEYRSQIPFPHGT